MNFLSITGFSAALIAVGGIAQAADVTPDVIFGDGNANGGFTVSNGIYFTSSPVSIPANLEIGLRAKLRFNENNLPENTFNYDGVDTYTFDAKAPPSGFSFAPNSPSTAIWNFEWSVNTDANVLFPLDGFTSLNALTYEIRIDGDPTAGTNFLTFDPINQPIADHAIGNNLTGNGGGTTAMSETEYATLINENQVAQNSWNYEFFDAPGNPLENFIGATPGEYRIEFEAFLGSGDARQSIASTGINVNSVAAVPLPAGLPLLATALAGFGLLRLRRKS